MLRQCLQLLHFRENLFRGELFSVRVLQIINQNEELFEVRFQMGGTEFIKKTMTTYLLSHTLIKEDEVFVVMRQFLKVEKAFNGNFLALRIRNSELREPALSESATAQESQEKGGEYLEETKEPADKQGKQAVHLEFICHMSTP